MSLLGSSGRLDSLYFGITGIWHIGSPTHLLTNCYSVPHSTQGAASPESALWVLGTEWWGVCRSSPSFAPFWMSGPLFPLAVMGLLGPELGLQRSGYGWLRVLGRPETLALLVGNAHRG